MAEAPEKGRAPVLPATIAACLFDLDGVLTQTATVHAAASNAANSATFFAI